MTQTIKFSYEDSCDLINALETLARILPDYGVDLEILDGGDGYEEIRLTKMETPDAV
jgi:hypothetical protein